MKNKALDSNLDFNGQGGTGYSRDGRRGVCANPYSIGAKAESQNYGMGPRKGNASSSPVMKGIEPKMTISTAAGGGPIVGHREAKCPTNPEKINMGLGPRKGNA